MTDIFGIGKTLFGVRTEEYPQSGFPLLYAGERPVLGYLIARFQDTSDAIVVPEGTHDLEHEVAIAKQEFPGFLSAALVRDRGYAEIQVGELNISELDSHSLVSFTLYSKYIFPNLAEHVNHLKRPIPDVNMNIPSADYMVLADSVYTLTEMIDETLDVHGIVKKEEYIF